MTPEERKQWDVDPDLWPHTPPYAIFRELYEEDDNLWWRAGSGHGMNAYDAALERIDELEGKDELNQPCPHGGSRVTCERCLDEYIEAETLIGQVEDEGHS